MRSFWSTTPQGVRIGVRLTPKGGRDGFDGVETRDDGKLWLKARVRAAPEDGRANAALARMIAQAAGVAPSMVELVSGASARQKVFAIRGAPEALAAKLAALAVAT
jgi:hypothetical protein